MHSHHSHSGDYVSHAVGSLDQMVQTAIDRQFTHFCLTEHMPRLHDKYLYPEELEKKYTTANLHENFDNFLGHAQVLKKEIKDLTLLVGFEVEGLDDEHIAYARELMKTTDMCVGSVHYVNGIPIDFSTELWLKARDELGGTRALYKEYFDLISKVLELEPQVVGHFDLIRLFEVDDVDPTTGKTLSAVNIQTDWPDVWEAIVSNIKKVVSYGGLFELNSAAIRKGWSSPYPRKDMAKLIISLGGKFCLSDDSHAYTQVGLNYHKVWDYVLDLKLDKVYHLDLQDGQVVVVGDSVEELSKAKFWDQFQK